MLYQIVDPGNFARCFEAVRDSYWPERIYLSAKERLPEWRSFPPPDQALRETKDCIRVIAKDISSRPHYRVFGTQSALVMPYLIHFHNLFLKRQWDEPKRDPQNFAEDYFRLQLEPGMLGNCSANNGNYHHFCNVVAATARLINYFNSGHRILSLLRAGQKIAGVTDVDDGSADRLAYTVRPGMRTFKLMLAAYYHDIGKSIVDRRHGMEGALLLSSETNSTWQALAAIVKQYHPNDGPPSFDCEDLSNIAEMVRHHDIYGTLATGEAGYLRLCEVIQTANRVGLRHRRRETQREWSWRFVFDLWVLNVADIMVSRSRKFEPQKEWNDPAAAERKIAAFFGTDDEGTPLDNSAELAPAPGHSLVHDLLLSYKLLSAQSDRVHAADTTELHQAAYSAAQDHGIERIRRLAIATLPRPAGPGSDPLPLAEHIRGLSDESQSNSIVNAVKSVAPVDEFVARLAWIGQLDYALAFFSRIATVAAEVVQAELEGKGPTRTGWLCEDSGGIDGRLRAQLQARQFFENYVAVVTEIIGHILFRERTVSRPMSVEFSDANERLRSAGRERTEEIAAFNGPNRYRRGIHTILQSVFLF